MVLIYNYITFLLIILHLIFIIISNFKKYHMKNIFYLLSFSYFKHILKINKLKILYNQLQKQ